MRIYSVLKTRALLVFLLPSLPVCLGYLSVKNDSQRPARAASQASSSSEQEIPAGASHVEQSGDMVASVDESDGSSYLSASEGDLRQEAREASAQKKKKTLRERVGGLLKASKQKVDQTFVLGYFKRYRSDIEECVLASVVAPISDLIYGRHSGKTKIGQKREAIRRRVVSNVVSEVEAALEQGKLPFLVTALKESSLRGGFGGFMGVSGREVGSAGNAATSAGGSEQAKQRCWWFRASAATDGAASTADDYIGPRSVLRELEVAASTDEVDDFLRNAKKKIQETIETMEVLLETDCESGLLKADCDEQVGVIRGLVEYAWRALMDSLHSEILEIPSGDVNIVVWIIDIIITRFLVTRTSGELLTTAVALLRSGWPLDEFLLQLWIAEGGSVDANAGSSHEVRMTALANVVYRCWMVYRMAIQRVETSGGITWGKRPKDMGEMNAQLRLASIRLLKSRFGNTFRLRRGSPGNKSALIFRASDCPMQDLLTVIFPIVGNELRRLTSQFISDYGEHDGEILRQFVFGEEADDEEADDATSFFGDSVLELMQFFNDRHPGGFQGNFGGPGSCSSTRTPDSGAPTPVVVQIGGGGPSPVPDPEALTIRIRPFRLWVPAAPAVISPHSSTPCGAANGGASTAPEVSGEDGISPTQVDPSIKTDAEPSSSTTCPEDPMPSSPTRPCSNPTPGRISPAIAVDDNYHSETHMVQVVARIVSACCFILLGAILLSLLCGWFQSRLYSADEGSTCSGCSNV